MIVVVDDLRDLVANEFLESYAVFRTSREAIEFLENLGPDDVIDEIWLDHDLGGDDTTRPVADWIEANDPDIYRIYIHTSNPVGRNYLKQALKSWNPDVVDAGKYLIADYSQTDDNL